MIRCITLSCLALSASLYTVHAQEHSNSNNVPELFLSETYLGFDEQVVAPRGANNLRRGLQETSSNVCRPVSSMTVALPDMTGLTCDQLPKYDCTCTGSAETTCSYCLLRTHPAFVQCQVSGSVMTFKDITTGVVKTCGCEYVGNGTPVPTCYYQDGSLVPTEGTTTTTGGGTIPTSAPVTNPTMAPEVVEAATTTAAPEVVEAATTTAAPVTSPTSAPVEPITPAPVTPLTAAPIVPPTPAPVTPTSAPVTPTAAPVFPTRAPVAPTSAPVLESTTTTGSDPMDELPLDGPGAPKEEDGPNGKKGGKGLPLAARFGGFW